MPKLIVLYPPPADLTTFERRYQKEHAPMVFEKVPGVTKFLAAKVLGSPAGAAPYQSILERTSSGDACVNDCSVHPLVQQLPFGGVGNAGMGKYHGHWGFEAFTNARGVLYHSALIDPGVKYPPYSEHVRERTVLKKLMQSGFAGM